LLGEDTTLADGCGLPVSNVEEGSLSVSVVVKVVAAVVMGVTVGGVYNGVEEVE
jgi:hypothetical protein